MAEFESWLGHKVGFASDYFSGSSWEAIEHPSWWLNSWASSPYQVVYSVPMLPDSEGSLQEGARGAYNDHFVKLAQTLIDHGQAQGILRLGWEMNGSWYRWSAKSDPGAFAEYWRQVVTAMRSVPGARFQFDWCPTLGPAAVNADRAYPGDEYVDYIGADIYDQEWSQGWEDPAKRWQHFLEEPFGLRWHKEFAAAHKKQMTYPEWALSARSDGHGGGDNPSFIQRMYDWISSNKVAYAIYFEYDLSGESHELMSGRFPLANAQFRELFG